MEYIVYIADECREEAKAHNYTDALEKLARDVEQKQSVANFDQFPAPFLVKKKFRDISGRLIAAQEIVNVNDNEYVVLKFLAVLLKGHEYDDFQDKRIANRDKYLRRVNSAQLMNFVAEKIKKDPPKKKQGLSREEEEFLYDSKTTYSLENESLVYESENWIKNINAKPYNNYLSHIKETLIKIVESVEKDKHSMPIDDSQNCHIVYFAGEDNSYVFLVGLCSMREEIDRTVEQWEKRFESADITRLARRAYPDYLIYDPEFWFELEKDTQSNFALSGEEINVLKSISEQSPFPLFVNGRAGSGKSTILQYIFAEYFFRYLSYQDAVPPPVYFTYNSKLLELAKKNVFGLLRTNSKFVEDIKDMIADDDDLSEKLGDSFKELGKYLLHIVDEKDKFQPDKYVNYSVFTRLWQKQYFAETNAKKVYPADISWHVIRTYIEGISPEDYLEPEEYVGLEKNQKRVSPELYQTIYKTVWEWYRNLKEEQKLWDDQDLVRYIIENDLATPRFSGIFCDESQDFTRIEMEVIYRLSIFSERDIPPQYVSKIPFAFVGDELQTINPTGFRWDAITALFTDKFILSVYPDKSKISAKPNFKELKNNYRSTQNIVNFCNALQLFRANRFIIPNLLPQSPWENTGGPGVARFDPKDAVFWQKIKEKPDSVIFIIPCNEGEEIKWIEDDPELKANIDISSDNKTTDITVLSANSAKGLEFDQVVVWKFGSEDDLDKLINKPANEDAARLLRLEYHINKTYVAISRAKNKLYILDDDTGINKLWRVTKDNALINTYLSGVNRTQMRWDHNNLETFKEGSLSDFSDNIIINQEENARQLMETGLNNRSFYLLRQAARIFMNLKNTQDSAKCSGYAELFENNYFPAGEHFLSNGHYNLAIQAFFLANTLPNDIKGFEKVIEISTANSALANSIFYRVALSVCSISAETASNLLDFLLDNNSTWQFEKYFPHDAMMAVIGGALNKCLNQIIDRGQFTEGLLHKTIDLHQQNKIIVQPGIIAQGAFSLSDYRTALAYWDKSDSKDRDPKKYETAQMHIKGFPDNISILFSNKNYPGIVNEYEKFEGELPNDALLLVIQALFFENKHGEAFDEIVNLHSSLQFEKILQDCSSCLDPKEKSILSVCQRVSIIFNESWNKNLKLIEEWKYGNVNPIYVAMALARTEELPTQSKNIQIPFSDFLDRKFIQKFENVPDALIFDIGTAIEKANKRVDILKYYEMAAKRFTEDAESERICIERWIRAKEMQARLSGPKAEANLMQEAAEKRKKYGIEGPIEGFIKKLGGKSDVIKYIIDSEMNKTDSETDKEQAPIKAKSAFKVTVHSKNKEITPDHTAVKQKTEFDLEGYHFAFFAKARRLNITSNADGKAISLHHSNRKEDWILNQDYSVTNGVNEELGDCQKIEGTPICFCITEDKISLSFENTKMIINFL